jgi:Protein of unknown function DUF262/HNH endonuclease
MPEIVNLDALIQREDFEISEGAGQSQFSQTVQIRDLEKDSFFYNVLRKPDFQRETSEWNINRIADFIKSYLDGDLIPAIILWQAGTNIFIIDGAHRLSALIAWVNDDYGDGVTSKMFFDAVIPRDQLESADKTRRHIKRNIGTYEEHKFAIQYPEKSRQDIIERARRLASLALQLQWVNGDARKAEASFFKINQQAVPIDKTELRLLQARHKPNAIAARAIIRAGTGHKYWSLFSTEMQDLIEQEANANNSLLFTPELRTPIKTLDLPVAGRGYSSLTLPLVADFVNIINDVKNESDLSDDADGSNTLKYLKNCRKILNRVTGVHPSSLGLHPVVYFYSTAGRYQTTSFFAILAVIKEFEARDYYRQFISIRRKFEDFILKYKIFPIQIGYRYGSGLKGYIPLASLYSFVVERMLEGKNEEDILKLLQASEDFSFLQPKETESLDSPSKDFSTETKSAAFLREALQSPLRCTICGGLIHYNSISVDHIIRKEDGGLGTIDNAQLTHPYCNTTIKN